MGAAVKVAVFVDLWMMHAQLAERAQECQLLRAAVDDAAELLDGDARAVAEARERLLAVRASTGPG